MQGILPKDQTERWQNSVFDVDVDVKARVEFQGRSWKIGELLYDAGFVFRNTDDLHNFFYLATPHRQDPLRLSLARRRGLIGHDEWKNMLELALANQTWGRVLWFDINKEPMESRWYGSLSLLLSPTGHGSWCYSSDDENICPFDLDADAPAFEDSDLAWQEWATQALQNHTDCRFAFRFALFSHKSRCQLALEWKYGNLAEFERLCTWGGQFATEWPEGWKAPELSASIFISLHSSSPIVMESRSYFPDVVPDITKTKLLWEWVRSVCSIAIKPSMRQRKSVTSWFEANLASTAVTLTPPTGHERMASLDALRDWARTIGVADELEDLLRTLSHA